MVELRFPLVDPDPPRLSEHPELLRRIEASGVFSNNGPELQAFEAEATARLFGGRGACLGVANATLGLMIAIRQAMGRDARRGGLALMPALTFAAAAQAADPPFPSPRRCRRGCGPQPARPLGGARSQPSRKEP